MDIAPLHCPSCGARIPGEEVHLELSLARCTSCRAVFDLAGRAPAGAPRPVERAPAPLPPKFKVAEQRGQSLSVKWRWFKPISVFLAFFCLFWDGFLVVWYSIAFGMEDSPLMMKLFPLIHVAVGLGLTYFTVATFVNTTEIEATRSRLQVRHGPLPWAGNLSVDANELKQLYGMEHRHRTKNGTNYTWSLNAVDRQGHRKVLLSGLDEVGQVLWLEQALERTLRIQDAPVEGEVARRSA